MMSIDSVDHTQKMAPNVGIYIDSAHNLWLDDAKQNTEDAKTGDNVQPGEVTVAIKATGICG